MTTIEAFKAVINRRGIGKSLDLTKQQIWYYRHNIDRIPEDTMKRLLIKSGAKIVTLTRWEL